MSRSIEEEIAEISANVPADEWAKVHADSADDCVNYYRVGYSHTDGERYYIFKAKRKVSENELLDITARCLVVVHSKQDKRTNVVTGKPFPYSLEDLFWEHEIFLSEMQKYGLEPLEYEQEVDSNGWAAVDAEAEDVLAKRTFECLQEREEGEGKMSKEITTSDDVARAPASDRELTPPERMALLAKIDNSKDAAWALCYLCDLTDPDRGKLLAKIDNYYDATWLLRFCSKLTTSERERLEKLAREKEEEIAEAQKMLVSAAEMVTYAIKQAEKIKEASEREVAEAKRMLSKYARELVRAESE